MSKDLMLEMALKYLRECKFSVFPVGRSKDLDGKEIKKPYIEWLEYQKRLPTEEEVISWWEKYPHANIGVVTGKISGVIVIDLDANKLTGSIELAKKNISEYVRDSLVFPVVRTPSGGEHWYFAHSDSYSFLRNDAKKVVPEVDLRAEGGFAILPPSYSSDKKYYTWLDGLSIFDTPLPELPAEYIERYKKVKSSGDKTTVKEILAAGVSEGARNDSLARIAGALFQKGLTLDEALRLCMAWNQTLEIPLPLGEVSATVGSISKKHSVGAESKPSGMPLIKLSDLLKEPDELVSWLVDKTLPAGGFSVIAAKPKVGKSTIARNLAFCISKGEPFLGKTVSQGSVIYYALEEKKSEVKKHFQDMGSDGTEDIFIYTGGTPVDAIQQIRGVVVDIKPVLIIIDPLFRLTKIKDGNDYAQVTMALEPLLRLARDTGTHVLCVHHSGKGDRQGGDSVLGSTAIFGSVDTLLIMKRHEEYRTICSIQRYGEDLTETTLHYDKVSRTIEIGKPKIEEDIDSLKKAIMEFLSSQGEPVIKSVIMEETDGRQAIKHKALMELVKNRQVIREGKGGKGDPYKYGITLLPEYIGVIPKQNPENGQNPYGCSANGITQDFAENQKSEKSRVIAFSAKKNNNDIILTNKDFEVVE